LTLGLVSEFTLLFPLAIIVGLLSDMAGPAHAAMIADLLPEDKRQEGFGILRVVANMSWIIGPTIGGFVANRSYLALFVTDAVVSCVVALLFYMLIPETKPEPKEGEEAESLAGTFRGYARVLRDRPFVTFIMASILMGVVYIQMYNSLSVYLRDAHGVTPSGYGFILTSSAITVILFQFWTTRVIKKRPPFAMMAFGTLFYVIGFGMYGFVGAYALFVVAMVIITVGEMVVVPTASTLAANFAPEAMRGRYMAVFSFVWQLPATIGPAAAGYVLDNFDPELLWYIGAGMCIVASWWFYMLHLRLGAEKRFAAAPEAEPAT
jgi:predicted MFS family arabinose efflux permease